MKPSTEPKAFASFIGDWVMYRDIRAGRIKV
jgi:hypothetical protein